MDPSKQEWHSTKEVCVRLGMDRRQLRDYIEAGVFPRGIKRGKQSLVWSTEDLAAMVWLEKNRHRLRASKRSDTPSKP